MVNADKINSTDVKKGFAYFYEDLEINYLEFIKLFTKICPDFKKCPFNYSMCNTSDECLVIKYLSEEICLMNVENIINNWNVNFSNKLFKIKFHRSKKYYSAFVTFAYDDIYTDNIKIEFLKPLDKKLPQYSKMDNIFESNDKSINNGRLTFEDLSDDNKQSENEELEKDKKAVHQIIINNVGQGNFIELENDNNIFAFDIGLGRWLTKKNRTYWKKYIRERKYDNIFISHLHWDHYALITYFKDEQFNCNWYVSDKGKKPSYAYRYLDEIKTKSGGNLNCYNSSGLINSGIYNNIIWELYQGNTVSQTNKAMNGGGLILKLDYEDRKYLLTGDCDYKYIPIGAKKDKLTLLVIPHHGAKQDKISSYNDMQAAEEGAYAIVSVGKNTYGHPTVQHIINIIKRGFDVYSTHDNGTIIVDLDTTKLSKEK